MYDVDVALKDAIVKFEVAIDGGKDSLSMVAQVGGEIVKTLYNLVTSIYVTCHDITKTTGSKSSDFNCLGLLRIKKGKKV